MKHFTLVPVVLLALFVGVNIASANFDNANNDALILWSEGDVSSTMVTAEPGDFLTLYAVVNTNQNYYEYPYWQPCIDYKVGTSWDSSVIDSPSVDWNNGMGYAGPNGQGDQVEMNVDNHLFYELGKSNLGTNNMWVREESRDDVAGNALWAVDSNRSITYGDGYGPRGYIWEGQLVTVFHYSVKEDVLSTHTTSTGYDEYGQPYQYYDSPLGLEFHAYSTRSWGSHELLGWTMDGPVTTLRVAVRPPPPAPGDFDGDGDVDADDIDLFCANMTGQGVPPSDPKYDLDGDGDADGDDLAMLVHDLVETTVGVGSEFADFNLDGEVNTTDLTILATNFGVGSTWAEGNANCDATIDTTDLTILATNFGFVASGAVPEPATMSLLGLGGLALIRRRRK